MISQLNTRLISSRVGTMTTSSVGNSGYASSGSDRSRSSNGYAADRSDQPSLTSHVKSSESSMKRSNDMVSLSVTPPALKRLRTNYNNAELHYLASKAKEVMEQAGLVYPKLETNTFLPNSGVNMSGVSHKFSSQCDSPFLGPDTGNNVGHNYAGLCPNEMNSLLQSTCSYYSLTPDTGNIPLPTSFSKVVQMMQQSNTVSQPVTNNNYEKEIYSDTESSTSSVTVSDNGGGVNCHRSSNVQPHSEGPASDSPPATFANSANVNHHHHPPEATTTTTTSAIVTIGQALEISRRPRILTSAQAPYHVVQVNAAFLRLSHSKSTNDFLGKPLEECLQLSSNGADHDDDDHQSEHESVSLAAGLKSSYTTMQKVSVPGYPNLLRRQMATSSSSSGNANVHRVTIVPVGVPPKLNEAAKVTHFAIKISVHPTPKRSRPTSTSSSLSTTSSHLSNTTPSTGRSNHHSQADTTGAIHVMG